MRWPSAVAFHRTGQVALPGGFVLPNEDLDTAARRELGEETRLPELPGHLEQLATYRVSQAAPEVEGDRVAYLAMAPDLPVPSAGSDAAAATWLPVDD